MIKTGIFVGILTVFNLVFNTSPIYAITDPRTSENNRLGIHIISPTVDEINPAATLVNSSGGDWGYVTVVIQLNDRDKNKWQAFFNQLREKHLIPIVRLATKPDNDWWERPNENSAREWADFLNSLNWPTKNRYVIIYNEPNHAKEWGNSADPVSYAQTLDKTITLLKSTSDDFFILNAGFDASAPNKNPDYWDEVIFLQEMDRAVPGIFNKLDGWVSHSYPNPGFVSSPNGRGRGSVRTWQWEAEILKDLGVNRDLPIFITETGWKHAEGKTIDPSLPSADSVAQFYTHAFENAWNNERVVAVTPFLLTYLQGPFDHFSFKNVLGATNNDYYPQYHALVNFQKSTGKPEQVTKAQLNSHSFPKIMIKEKTYTATFIFKNIGQSIWSDGHVITLKETGNAGLKIEPITLPADVKVKPDEEYAFKVHITPQTTGEFSPSFSLFVGQEKIDSEDLTFQTEVVEKFVFHFKNILALLESYNSFKKTANFSSRMN